MNAAEFRSHLRWMARVDDGLFPSGAEDRLEAARQDQIEVLTAAQRAYCMDAMGVAGCSQEHVVAVIQSLQTHVVLLELERDRAVRALRMWLEDDGKPDQPARAMDMARRVVASITEVAP